MALFITFEGIEGSGKTTQIKLLSKLLKSRKIKHVLTREPGGTELGNRLRRLVLVPRYKSNNPYTELCIMLAARADHASRVIRKNLDAGISVICDRFTDATLAYQGGGRNIDINLIRRLNDLVTFNTRPDLTILLDLPAESGLKRAKMRLSRVPARNRESRFENEKIAFHKKVRNAYLKLRKTEPKRIHLVNATQSIPVIAGKIKGIVLNELK